MQQLRKWLTIASGLNRNFVFHLAIPIAMCNCHKEEDTLVPSPEKWQTLSSACLSEVEVTVKVSKPQEAKLLSLRKFESIITCLVP